jgi:hypothetical protein
LWFLTANITLASARWLAYRRDTASHTGPMPPQTARTVAHS